MVQIKVVPLGAGQDVGKSCILITIGGKNIMLDCGMHPGFNDSRRFPDFRYISREGNFTQMIDLVIISHFHLDHCGSLPYFTECLGYDGPLYATHPTKAIMPILLEDYRKISVERRGVEAKDFFNSEQIKQCMLKVTACALEETVTIEPDFEIRPYYAGHVLGAAMFYIRVGQQSILYTGDYNMTPDRHLGSARCDKLRPDLMITESTYATTIRESKRWRERDLLEQVTQTVRNGGKVLIPVFALGRAQELCLLLDAHWERTGLDVPIYFSAGLTEKANWYYKLYISWTNQKIKDTFVKRNVFDFQHIRPFDRALVDAPGPMVLFATPGMLHGGLSMEVFKKWAPYDSTLVIMPGYCVAGTLGHKVLSNGGKPQVIQLPQDEGGGQLHVRCKIRHLSFSAHADAKGIMTLIKQVEPANVMLVHGERQKMEFLKGRIQSEFGLPCYDPANGATAYITTHHQVPVQLSTGLLGKRRTDGAADTGGDVWGVGRAGGGLSGATGGLWTKRPLAPTTRQPVLGVLCVTDAGEGKPNKISVLAPEEAGQFLNVPQWQLSMRHRLPTATPPLGAAAEEVAVALEMALDFEGLPVDRAEHGGVFELSVRSVKVEVGAAEGTVVEYSYADVELARVIWGCCCKILDLPDSHLPLPRHSETSVTVPGAPTPESGGVSGGHGGKKLATGVTGGSSEQSTSAGTGIKQEADAVKQES